MTTKQIASIKSVLGGHYAPKIIKYLNKKQVFNANGEPFKNDSIQKIVKGTQPNASVERSIIQLVAIEKRKQKKLETDKRTILKK
jgi:hypothetical protein